MRYGEARRRERDEIKARLLAVLQKAEANGEHVSLYDLAPILGRSRSGLTILWHELAREGKIAYRSEERRSHGQGKNVRTSELAARIAAVREAKVEAWRREQRKSLTDEELDEALPT